NGVCPSTPRFAAVIEDPDLVADFGEGVERELQLFARMRRRHDRANPRLVSRNRRKSDSLRENAFFEQSVRQLHRQRGVTDDHRRDRTLAEAGVEAERLQPCLEKSSVLPESIDQLWLLEEHINRRNAGGGDCWRMGRRKEEGPRSMIE